MTVLELVELVEFIVVETVVLAVLIILVVLIVLAVLVILSVLAILIVLVVAAVVLTVILAIVLSVVLAVVFAVLRLVALFSLRSVFRGFLRGGGIRCGGRCCVIYRFGFRSFLHRGFCRCGIFRGGVFLNFVIFLCGASALLFLGNAFGYFHFGDNFIFCVRVLLGSRHVMYPFLRCNEFLDRIVIG